jgi:hypothetical protein
MAYTREKPQAAKVLRHSGTSVVSLAKMQGRSFAKLNLTMI